MVDRHNVLFAPAIGLKPISHLRTDAADRSGESRSEIWRRERVRVQNFVYISQNWWRKWAQITERTD